MFIICLGLLAQSLVVFAQEGPDGWDIPVTAFTAGYSTQVSLSPTHSMRTGITVTSDNIFSYSDAWQAVTIPSNIRNATLQVMPAAGSLTSTT